MTVEQMQQRMAQDPVNQWTRRLQNNIFSGGLAGILLVLVTLTVMIAVAILAIVAGYELLTQAGFQPRKRNLWPFASAGIAAGLLFFRISASTFYKLTREARTRQLAASLLLLICVVAPAHAQRYSQPVADGIEFPVPDGWIFDTAPMGANLAPKAAVGAFNRGEEYYAVRLLAGVTSLDEPDVLGELAGEGLVRPGTQLEGGNGKIRKVEAQRSIKGKEYRTVAWLVELPKGGVVAVVGFGGTDAVNSAAPALESIAAGVRHRLGGSVASLEDSAFPWFRQRMEGFQISWAQESYELHSGGKYTGRSFVTKHEGEWRLIRHAQNFFLETRSTTAGKRFLKIVADGDAIKSDRYLNIKPLATAQASNR